MKRLLLVFAAVAVMAAMVAAMAVPAFASSTNSGGKASGEADVSNQAGQGTGFGPGVATVGQSGPQDVSTVVVPNAQTNNGH